MLCVILLPHSSIHNYILASKLSPIFIPHMGPGPSTTHDTNVELSQVFKMSSQPLPGKYLAWDDCCKLDIWIVRVIDKPRLRGYVDDNILATLISLKAAIVSASILSP
jgi:hypothetical protein